jgi:DNA-binding MarR family transcriptional regulator
MEEQTRERLVQEVAQRVATLQEATDEVDAAAAQRMGLNRTDMRCVGRLFFGGPATAKDLAAATRLTPGALTTALDRLERAGYTRRVEDPADRRRVRVELTSTALELIGQTWGPLGQQAQGALRRYSPAHLRIIRDFLDQAIDTQLAHAARIRAATRRASTSGPRH